MQRFEYDAEQRLTRIHQTKHGERLRIEYQYDPLGRRIGKQVYRHDDLLPHTRTEFHWQGLRLLQEVQNGTPCLYLYAHPDSYEPMARVDGNPGAEQIFYFHTNLAGLPEQLTDEQGLSVWHSEFKAWGNSTNEWQHTQHNLEQNLRFQGQYLDRETGLHYNTFRFYDPDIGRFTQPDPIGLLGGINLYQYAPNPVGWIDPWGLSNSINSTNAQHGYYIRDTWNGDAPVKVGISGQKMNKNRTSRRANGQVNTWNNEPGNTTTNPDGTKNYRYKATIEAQIPEGKDARKNMLQWEAENTNKHADTIDSERHKRPAPRPNGPGGKGCGY